MIKKVNPMTVICSNVQIFINKFLGQGVPGEP